MINPSSQVLWAIAAKFQKIFVTDLTTVEKSIVDILIREGFMKIEVLEDDECITKLVD